MAYPEPNNLDDIYGPGAEAASVPDDHADCLFEQCAECGHTWPMSEIQEDGCPDCLFQRERERNFLDYIEAGERREAYYRDAEGG